jgi:hypothetical protein
MGDSPLAAAQHVYGKACGDAVVHQWIIDIGIHHLRVMGQRFGVQFVAEREGWPQIV